MKKPDFSAMDKIDAHVHIRYSGPEFLDQAKADNFRVLAIVTDHYDIPWQEGFIAQQQALRPTQFAYCTSFTIKHWDDPDWERSVIGQLRKAFQQGAIAVKIWKNIGMVAKDKHGEFIMIDNPRFDPILDFIAAEGKTLTAHLGEPKDCWLPLEKMVAASNKGYYSSNPEYHMFLHPEYPSYEAQIAAFDHMLGRHPRLRVVGAHLASTEWSMAELGKRLQKFPNLAVDLAARIDDIQYLDRQEVHDFFIEYQDSILYATDRSIKEHHDPQQFAEDLHGTWLRDWKYLATNEEVTIPGTEKSVCGLNLPPKVLEKVYYLNAKKWYPGL